MKKSNYFYVLVSILFMVLGAFFSSSFIPQDVLAVSTECKTDADCNKDGVKGYKCVKGLCVKTVQGCVSDKQCGPGEECKGGSCRPCNGSCRTPVPGPYNCKTPDKSLCHWALDHSYGEVCNNNQLCYYMVEDYVCPKIDGLSCNDCGWNGASSAEDTIPPTGPKCIIEFKETYVCVPKDCSKWTPVPTVQPTTKPTVSPTIPPTSAKCSGINIYTTNWVLLKPAAFSALGPRVQVYFCVNGVSTGGAFDKARFTINSTLRPDTTIKRPGTNDFCDLYTIPYGVVNFAVQGELHHTTLGWL